MINLSSVSSVDSPGNLYIPSASRRRAGSGRFALFAACVLFSLFPPRGPSCDGEEFSHPRLFFSSEELAELRVRRLGDLAGEWALLIDRCEFLEKSTYPAADPAGEPLREYDKMLLTLAFVQLIDADQPYQGAFENFFWTVLHWDEWATDPGGVGGNLETYHLIRGLAIAYDWLYDTFSPSERQEICDSLSAYMSNLYTYDAQFKNSQPLYKIMHNIGYNAHNCLAAVVYGVDNIPPADYATWKTRLDERYDLVVETMNSCMYDGACQEGMQYYTYGLENLLQWLEMRRRFEGLTGGAPYDSIPHFQNASIFMLHMIVPGGSDNYGGPATYNDSQPHTNTHPRYIYPLLAMRLDDPVAQWLASDLDGPYNFNRETDNVWRYIYSGGAVEKRDPSTLPNWHLFPEMGIFAWRSSWGNDATYFTLRSGRHFGGHCQVDDGQFMIFRDGVPYVVDLGYEDGQRTGYHNVLLVDGEGQITDGGTGQDFPFPDTQGYRGQVLHLLASGKENGEPGAFFDVVVDPEPMYTSTKLTEWRREAVGFGDLFLVRDVVSTSASADLELRIHSYVSSDYRDSWEFQTYRDVNPITAQGGGRWEIYPRMEAGRPKMLVVDLSRDIWASSVEETWYNDWTGANSRLGNYISRQRTGTAAASLVSFAFDDDAGGWTQAAWNDPAAEGARVTRTSDGAKVLDVLWPSDGSSCTNSDGWDLSGKMAGRRYALYDNDPRHALFVREATLVRQNGTTLLSAPHPVSLYATLDHDPAGGTPNRMVVAADVATEITLDCPYMPRSVYRDGAAIPFFYNAATEQLTVTVPPTEGATLELSDDDFLLWINFQPEGSAAPAGFLTQDASPYGSFGSYGWR